MIKEKMFVMCLGVLLCALLMSCSNSDEIDLGNWTADLGFLTDQNEFIQEWAPIIQHGLTVDELRRYRYSRGAVTIRLSLGKNSDTRDIREFDADVNFIRTNNERLPRLRIQFFRNGETASHYLFTTQVARNGEFVKGKPILLVLEPELALEDDPDFYLLPADLNTSLEISIRTGQF